jgi:hypothetical protein
VIDCIYKMIYHFYVKYIDGIYLGSTTERG